MKILFGMYLISSFFLLLCTICMQKTILDIYSIIFYLMFEHDESVIFCQNSRKYDPS